MRGTLDLHDPLYSSALYSEADVSRMLALPPSTLRRWTRGYNYKTVEGLHGSDAIVTTARRRFGKTIPFIGLVEASVYASVRAAGVPVQRIRPAVEVLQQRTGLVAALMSERLKTDGVDLLWEFGSLPIEGEDDGDDRELAVLRTGQMVFPEVVRDYLQTIEYVDGLARVVRLMRWTDVDVVADPAINGGQPTLRDHGLRVVDITDRAAAGESVDEIADDFRLPESTVARLLAAA